MNSTGRIGARRRVALLLAAAAGASDCASPRALVPRRTPSALARSHLERGEALLARGEEEAALEAFRQAIRETPAFVEAHRALQDVRDARLEKGALLAEYREALEREPHRPEFHYLLGRLLRPVAAQRRAFEETLARDPDFAFARYGLAYAHRVEGRPRRAEEEYRAAIAAEPRLPQPRLGLVELLLVEGKPREALAEARRAAAALPNDSRAAALASTANLELGRDRPALEEALRAVRLGPASPPAFRALERAIEKRGSEDDLRRARDAVRRSIRESPAAEATEAERKSLLATVESRLGNVDEALRLDREAIEAGHPPHRAALRRRRHLLVVGDFEGAVEGFLDSLPPRALEDAASRPRERFLALRPAASQAAREPRNASSLLRFASALREAGLLEEARLVASRARRFDPADGEAAALEEEVDRYARFIASLREAVLGGSADARRPRDLRRFLRDLGALARRELGADVVAGSRTISFFPVGVVVDPDPGSPGLARHLDRYNRFVLLGRATGRPVDAVVLRAVSRVPLRGTLLGRAYEGEAVVGEEAEVATYRVSREAPILGAAAFRGYFVDLDAVRDGASDWEKVWRRHASRIEAILADPLPLARTEAEILALDEPLGLPAKLELLAQARRPGGFLDRTLSAVEAHERGHLADASAFLPLGRRWVEALAFFADSGFSRLRSEARLEARAELAAMAASEDPEIHLANLVEAATAPGRRTSHGEGYREVLDALVRRVWSRMAEHPELRPDRNLLQQCFRLPAQRLRDLALGLAREQGLVEDGHPTPSPRAAGK